MTPTIQTARFVKELMHLLEETFEKHHGIFLDKGTSLFETLARIPAEQNWDDGDTIGGALAIVVHTASHLGAIRQGLRAIT